MKVAITKDLRLLSGQLVINEESCASPLTGLQGARVPTIPAQANGKVERPIHYIRENFVYARDFLDEAHLGANGERW